MNVLALSLLRLGDIFMHLHVLATYKRHNPGHQITLMINEQFRHAEHLILSLSKVEQIVYFDRNLLQQGLLDKNAGVLYSYNALKFFVNSVQEQNFDRVINLTHNQLSARLVDLLSIKEVLGIGYVDGKVLGLQNQYLRYLNEHFSEESNFSFHYVDILKQAIGLKLDSVEQLKKQDFQVKRICIQLFSAEEKKEHNLQFWSDLIAVLRATGCALPIYIMCSPSEVERVSLMRVRLQNISDLHFVSPTLNELVNILVESLLITVDTSIKHIASHLNTAIVEISLGSSNPVKTSAYAENAYMLHSTRSCAPCSHSSPCHQSDYFCRQDILPQDVAIAAMTLTQEISGTDAKTIFSPHAQVMVSEFDEAGNLDVIAVKGTIAEKISDQSFIEKSQIKNHKLMKIRSENEPGA